MIRKQIRPFFIVAFFTLLLASSEGLNAQNLSVQYEQDQLLREYQLLNKLSNVGSLSIRPFMGRRPTDT
ncbi:MAG: hypothetical protein ACK487_01100, partial [Sphingomonadales bacterium]